MLESTEQLDVWERRLDALARAIPYVALLLSTVLYLVTPGDPAQDKLVNLVIAGVAAGWMLWWFTLHPAWRGRPVPTRAVDTGPPRYPAGVSRSRRG